MHGEGEGVERAARAAHMDAVAMASSCAYLPWMIEVMSAFWCLSTVVHTCGGGARGAAWCRWWYW